MAANEYFSGAPLGQQSNLSSTSAYAPYNPHSANQSTQSLSSTTNVPSNYKPRYYDNPGQYSPPTGPKPANEPYPDSQELKPGKLQTSDSGWPPAYNNHPPSPESQTNQQLLEQPKVAKKKGFFSGPVPWVVYTATVIQVTVFIVEIIRNAMLTGSPIMIQPQFNPMIGPSTYVQINMGARFVPCMHSIPGITDAPINWPCPNTTTTAANCDLSELCGFGGFQNNVPNQWFRFIVPMFLHAGLVHIFFNMFMQLTMGREMEKAFGSIRFALIYFSSGIFGFVLGGNYAATAIASTGCSGCLFGIEALRLLDLTYNWNQRVRPVRELMWILAEVIISFGLGLLPGLDNFSHIGGFIMGLAAGMAILHSPTVLRQRIDRGISRYQPDGSELDVLNPKSSSQPPRKSAEHPKFIKDPIGFFRGRKGMWWVWWLIRAGALVGVLVGFIVLLNNFYKYRNTCSWCKYLSCLPVLNWCNLGNLQLQNVSTSNTKRDLLELSAIYIAEWWNGAGLF